MLGKKLKAKEGVGVAAEDDGGYPHQSLDMNDNPGYSDDRKPGCAGP